MQGRVEKALEHYNKVIRGNRKYVDLATIRKAGIQIDKKDYQNAKTGLLALMSKGVESA